MDSEYITTMHLRDRTDDLDHALNRDDTIAAMRNLDAILNQVRDITIALVERGVHEGLTQAAMSRALGVPPSALRGAKREFAR